MSRSLARLLRRRHRPAWLACEDCGRDFVCPIEWAPEDAGHWRIATRCGACGAWREMMLTNAQADAWDAELDRQMRPIARAAHRLDHERMAGEAEAFVAALQHGLIEPADFA